MAPPGIMSFFDSTETNSPGNLMLSPFPSFSKCCDHSIITDHNYVFNLKNNNSSVKVKAPIVCFQDYLGDQHSKQMGSESTDDHNTISTSSVSSNSNSNDNVVCDVSLVSPQSSPEANETESDFLSGLDDLDFDFDMANDTHNLLEDNFQNFITSQLDDTLKVDNNNNANDIFDNNVKNDNDDICRKDFFMKHLRLKRVSNIKTSQRRDRKRKYEESILSTPSSTQTKDSDHSISHLNCHITSLHDNVSPLSSSFSFATNNSNSNAISIQIPQNNTTKNTQHSSLHSFVSNNSSNMKSRSSNINSNDVFLQKNSTETSTSNTFHRPSTVPYKTCSCSIGDWKNSILYSTAKPLHVNNVQTSPSTASIVLKPQYSTQDSSTSFFAELESNILRNKGRLSPSLILTESIKDYFELERMDTNQVDEDTEDLLNWLDCQQNSQSQPLSIVSNSVISDNDTINFSNNEIKSPSFPSSPTHSHTSSSDEQNSFSPECHRPDTSMAMESFVDLESYVNEAANSDHVTSHNQFELDYREESGIITDSKSHIRLSILDEISSGIINAEFSEKKVTSNHGVGYSSYESGCWYESIHSLPKYRDTPDLTTQEENENLRMLDMFGDENNTWCY